MTAEEDIKRRVLAEVRGLVLERIPEHHQHAVMAGHVREASGRVIGSRPLQAHELGAGGVGREVLSTR